MKAKYVKPHLCIENFGLSQNIASTCGVAWGGTTVGSPTHDTMYTCGWKVGDEVLWAEACGYDDPDDYYPYDMEFEGYCYNNPNGGTPIFGS